MSLQKLNADFAPAPVRALLVDMTAYSLIPSAAACFLLSILLAARA